MRWLMVAMILATGFGCAGKDGADGDDGSSCSVETKADGALITCDDGSTSFVSNGTNGVDGIDGQDGADGADGQDGRNGADGQDGDDAQGCTIQSFDGFFCIECPGQVIACTDNAKGCNEHAHLSDNFANSCECDLGYQLVFNGGDPSCAPDVCTTNGWYGDGVCDTFCPDPDLDCQ